MRDASCAENVYILLIRTNTWFSQIIHWLTGAEFTHASVSLKPGSGIFYSFARRYSRLPWPAGFIEERLDAGILGRHPEIPCALLRVAITPEVRESLDSQLELMCRRRRKLKYSFIGTIFCLFHRPRWRENHYFCSQFVALLLAENGAIRLQKPASLYHPVDFPAQPETQLCYRGSLRGLLDACHGDFCAEGA